MFGGSSLFEGDDRRPGDAPFVVELTPRSEKSKKEEEEIEAAEGERDTVSAKEKSKRRATAEPVEKQSGRELFDYVLNEGKKDYYVQRYKGLGEMTAPQLWETTMDPERRTLLSVRLEDIAECETIFTTLMGEQVDPRREFIEKNALLVGNLDL